MTERHHVVVDGSNLATEGRTLPSLAQLDAAVRAYAAEDPTAEIIVVVDATFGHRVDAAEKAQVEEAELHGEIVSPPAGTVGRGDAFLLKIAERTGATVISNDSFQEFHAEHPWLFEAGRLVGGKPVPGVGWIFTVRNPVRGVKSRQVTEAAKRAARKASVPPAPAAPRAAATAQAPPKARKVSAKTAPAAPIPAEPLAAEPVIPESPSPETPPAPETPAKKAPARASKAAKKAPAERAPAEKKAAGGKKVAAEKAPAGKKAAAEKAPTKARGAAKKAPARKAASDKGGAEQAHPEEAAAGYDQGQVQGERAEGEPVLGEKAPPKARKATKKAPGEPVAAPAAQTVQTAPGVELPGAPGAEPGEEAPAKVRRGAAAKGGTTREGATKSGASRATKSASGVKATAKKARGGKEAIGAEPEEGGPRAGAGGELVALAPAAAKRVRAKRGAPKGMGEPGGGGAGEEPEVLAPVEALPGTGAGDRLAPVAPEGRTGRARGTRAASEPLNEFVAFISFVEAHPVGSRVRAEVRQFTSHGAMVDVAVAGQMAVACYVPLRAMGTPAPSRARDVLNRGEEREFTVVALDSRRRVPELALVEAAGDIAEAAAEEVGGDVAAAGEGPRRGRRR